MDYNFRLPVDILLAVCFRRVEVCNESAKRACLVGHAGLLMRQVLHSGGGDQTQ